jgi:hypothetical protein
MVKQEAKAVEQPKAARKTRVAQFKELPLVITADDLAADVRNSLAATSSGGRLLGGEETLQAVYDELPGAIARRLKRIMPSDFRVAKVTLKLQLDVNIPGIKMGGTVDVTLEPS